MGNPPADTQAAMDKYLKGVRALIPRAQARKDAGITTERMNYFRSAYPNFKNASDIAWKDALHETQRRESDALIFDPYRDTPQWPEGPRMEYWIEWRQKYVGRPTPPHVMGFVQAYFDLTNRR